MSKIIDLTEQKFGRLIVIKRVNNNKWNRIVWLCRCDCGKEKNVLGNLLTRGRTKSCGCLRKEGNNKLERGLGSMRARLAGYKDNAKKRGLKWELTEEQFKEITQKDCYYCRTKPNNVFAGFHYNGDYIYNGIDRVNNIKGYIIDNVVPCCKKCNSAKGALTMREFSDWVSKIYHTIQKVYLKEGDNIEENI